MKVDYPFGVITTAENARKYYLCPYNKVMSIIQRTVAYDSNSVFITEWNELKREEQNGILMVFNAELVPNSVKLILPKFNLDRLERHLLEINSFVYYYCERGETSFYQDLDGDIIDILKEYGYKVEDGKVSWDE